VTYFRKTKQSERSSRDTGAVDPTKCAVIYPSASIIAVNLVFLTFTETTVPSAVPSQACRRRLRGGL
jgi:hypothetical protein